MTMQTLSFDPDNMSTRADLARDVGVTEQAFQNYITRHRDEFPAPLFVLRLRTGKALYLWSKTDGQQLVAEYRMRRALR